ncbi:MAG: hypothetical protein GX839_00245 [Fastidiosipila sp.]|nr:hypothetical protein [Fastidiosipila sp.]
MEEAIKTMKKPVAGWADSRVADLLARIRSPGLPRRLVACLPDADHYLFEHLEGETLRQLPQELLTSSNLQRWFDQVLDSLALISLFAGLPFAHLDLSPENIIVTREGRACLIDFASSRFLDGKADLPDTARSVTAGYAAREVYFGRLRPESDLFSLAMTLLAVCSGRMAAELEGRVIKKTISRLSRPFAVRLRLCLSEEPSLRQPAARGSLYQAVLEAGFKRSKAISDPGPEALKRPEPAGPFCPFRSDGCPFLDLADQLREAGQDDGHVLQ